MMRRLAGAEPGHSDVRTTTARALLRTHVVRGGCAAGTPQGPRRAPGRSTCPGRDLPSVATEQQMNILGPISTLTLGAATAAVSGGPEYHASACPAAFQLVPHGLMDEETTLGSAPANSTSHCCALCAARTDCVAWTLDAGATCWMTAHPVAPHGDNPSGIRVPIPGPAPSPPPSPPAPLPKVPTPRPPLGFQPNIVLFLTDDQA
jgi:hypothetical protein